MTLKVLLANKMAVGRPTYTSPMTLMLFISLSSISKHICCPCFTLNLYYAKSHSTLLALRVSPTSLTLLNDSIRTLCSAPDASLLTRGVLIRFLPPCLRKGKLLMYPSACAHSTRRLTAMFMCSNRSSHQSSLKDQLLMN
jgi:hypothetical protein